MSNRRWLGFALTLGLVTAGTGQAQGGRLHPAITGGVVFSTWTGSDVGSGANYRTGVHGGATLAYDLSPIIALQTGLIYSQEGVTADLGSGVSGTFKLDYLRVPVYLRVRFSGSAAASIRPYLFAGPVVGFKVNCSVEASSSGNSASADCDQLSSAGIEIVGTDFDGRFGVGADFGRFEIYGHYQIGFKSVIHAVSTGPTAPPAPPMAGSLMAGSSSDPDVKNQGFAIGVAFGF
jgi:hypothetical protein